MNIRKYKLSKIDPGILDKDEKLLVDTIESILSNLVIFKHPVDNGVYYMNAMGKCVYKITSNRFMYINADRLDDVLNNNGAFDLFSDILKCKYPYLANFEIYWVLQYRNVEEDYKNYLDGYIKKS